MREDYSASGDAWAYFPHEHARSRAYRWSEDGLAGFCDKGQTLCLAIALWNGQDPILKERLYGLANPEGNPCEDVKEVYYYEDATPTASYLRFAYKYPQRAFPYQELLDKNQGRSMELGEVELWDVGAFDEGRYFDVTVEYAKVGPNDVFMIVTVENKGDAEAPIHVLPHLWFRNTWSWGDAGDGRPRIHAVPEGTQGDDPHGVTPYSTMRAVDRVLGDYFFYVDGRHELLFTENDSNTARLWGAADGPKYAKDAFHDVVVGGDAARANPDRRGTKACAWARFDVPARGKVRVVARLAPEPQAEPFDALEATLAARRREAHAFYAYVQGSNRSDDRRAIHRGASAGLLWGLQFYNYDVDVWLRGDAHPPPEQRLSGRNREWRHISVGDVISMPDSWEYPWFAAWDLAFHSIAMSSVDIDQAKAQLKLMVKEWYQHPSGQIPAYEWEFSDLNPPVHAWATYQIYKIERKQRGKGDRVFLERVFHKLLINFAWWVNKRDDGGNNIFEGGFLGLDNISVFDRSEPLPPGTKLEQADATAWMAMYCLDLMRIALELAVENSAYEDLASKFFEHFLRIAYALHHTEEENDLPPWDDEEGFYYDILHEGGRARHLRVRSMVGLIPLFAVHVIDPATFRGLDNFRRRFEWFLARYPHLAEPITERRDGRRVLSGRAAGAPRARARAPVRRRQVPLEVRAALAVEGARGAPRRRVAGGAPSAGRLRAWRVDVAHEGRQFELAWSHLVPHWLPALSIAPPPRSRPRRHGAHPAQGRRARSNAARGSRRARRAHGVDLRARPRRQAARVRRLELVPGRPELPRSPALLRVLPRRDGRGPRRVAPDRLDRARRRARAPPRSPRPRPELRRALQRVVERLARTTSRAGA